MGEMKHIHIITIQQFQDIDAIPKSPYFYHWLTIYEVATTCWFIKSLLCPIQDLWGPIHHNACQATPECFIVSINPLMTLIHFSLQIWKYNNTITIKTRNIPSRTMIHAYDIYGDNIYWLDDHVKKTKRHMKYQKMLFNYIQQLHSILKMLYTTALSN